MGGNDISTQSTHESDEAFILIQYNRQKRCSQRNFTMGGCAGPEMLIHRTSKNNIFDRIFHFGRVYSS